MTWPTQIIGCPPVCPDLAPHLTSIASLGPHSTSAAQHNPEAWDQLWPCSPALFGSCSSPSASASTSACRKASVNCLNSLTFFIAFCTAFCNDMCVSVSSRITAYYAVWFEGDWDWDCDLRLWIKIGIKKSGFAIASSRQIWLYKLEATKLVNLFSFFLIFCLFVFERRRHRTPCRPWRAINNGLEFLLLLTPPPEFRNYHTQLCSPESLTQSL